MTAVVEVPAVAQRVRIPNHSGRKLITFTWQDRPNGSTWIDVEKFGTLTLWPGDVAGCEPDTTDEVYIQYGRMHDTWWSEHRGTPEDAPTAYGITLLSGSVIRAGHHLNPDAEWGHVHARRWSAGHGTEMATVGARKVATEILCALHRWHQARPDAADRALARARHIAPGRRAEARRIIHNLGVQVADLQRQIDQHQAVADVQAALIAGYHQPALDESPRP